MKKILTILMAASAITPMIALHAQPMDPDFAKSVKEWTTRPEFSSPLVDHLPLSDTIPSPKQVLGNHIGVPNKLHSQEQIIDYFRRLAAAAPDRVRIVEIGKTYEGRDNIVVLFSNAENMAKLDTHKRNHNLLADPRKINDEQAKQIIAETKPFYFLSAGLHSSETGPPEMTMELAYRLLTEDSDMIRKIRDNLIVAINPVLEGDGRSRYVDWYHQSLKDETNDLDKPGGPPYWGKYIYHDNNRDMNFSDVNARQLLAFYLDWKLPIMHELHESVPFLYTYSGQSPQNPELDPILYGELPFYANYEMSQLTKYGMPGVWTHGFVDAWSPGYVAFMASNHNGMLRMYETYGNGGATTMLRRVDGGVAANNARGGNHLKRDWFRPNPPYREVMWSIRNNTNYMQTGVLTALDLAATHNHTILENFYKKSKNAIERVKRDGPVAYVIPAGQKDQSRVKFVIDQLLLQGVEVGQANAAVRLGDKSFPAGSLIVKLDQPYGPLAKTLMRIQDNYPDEKLFTYDDAAWTIGLMTHTDVVEVTDKAALGVATTPVTNFTLRGSISNAGPGGYIVLDNGSVNLAVLRYRLKDTNVRIVEQGFKLGKTDVPAGSFLVPANAHSALAPAVVELGLTAIAAPANLGASTHEVAIPRTAVFSTWGSTEKVGWLRYAFDQYETPYDLIYKEQVRGGNLRDKYDVIILPNQGRTARDIVFDIPMKGKPLPYKKNDEFKSLGMYGESDDIRGGMGTEGLSELRKFVEQGGTLITTGNASEVPAAFGLVDDVTAAPAPGDSYAPGPIVKAKFLQPLSPIFYGYNTADTVSVRWATNTLLNVRPAVKGKVLMEFPGGKSSILSGFMRNADQIQNQPAIINSELGEGRVLMFATNPIWRWQTLGEYRMLYNAMLNWRSLGGATGQSPVKPAVAPAPDALPEFDDGTKSKSARTN